MNRHAPGFCAEFISSDEARVARDLRRRRCAALEPDRAARLVVDKG